MSEQVFSIGKMAELTGLSTQTLRYYSNLGLLKPEYVDENTGYRYYTFNQLHYIDRIKYLRSLGIPLEEIKEALRCQSPDRLISALEKQRDSFRREISELESQAREVDWYIGYFRHAVNARRFPFFCLRYFPERYALGIPFDSGEDTSTRETHLTHIRNSGTGRSLKYIRQYGYTVDFEGLCQGKFLPRQLYMFIKGLPPAGGEEIASNLLTFPAGNYLCYMDHFRSPSWNPQILREKMREVPEAELVLANEYEDNLAKYSECPYQLEILLNRDAPL